VDKHEVLFKRVFWNLEEPKIVQYCGKIIPFLHLYNLFNAVFILVI